MPSSGAQVRLCRVKHVDVTGVMERFEMGHVWGGSRCLVAVQFKTHVSQRLFSLKSAVFHGV